MYVCMHVSKCLRYVRTQIIANTYVRMGVFAYAPMYACTYVSYVSYRMLCSVMFCYVMLCYVMLCKVEVCDVM